jgi:hypothetical protein
VRASKVPPKCAVCQTGRISAPLVWGENQYIRRHQARRRSLRGGLYFSLSRRSSTHRDTYRSPRCYNYIMELFFVEFTE